MSEISIKGLTLREFYEIGKYQSRDNTHQHDTNSTSPIMPEAGDTPSWVWLVSFIGITLVFAFIIGGFAWVNHLDQQRDAQISVNDSPDSTQSVHPITEPSSKTSRMEAFIESFSEILGQNARAEAFRGAAQETLVRNGLVAPSLGLGSSPATRPADADQRIEEMEMGALSSTREAPDELEFRRTGVASAGYGACKVSQESISRGGAESPLVVAPKVPSSSVHVPRCGRDTGM
ncbi:hypothetical protein FRC03_003256 [Tulasnella sp. 419]|nr:hypothetical protein FRC03_003256 [Tulasnella sp. 419]